MPRRTATAIAEPSPTAYRPEMSRVDRYAESQKVGPSVRMVTVACKLVTGLQLQLQRKQPRIVAGRDGDEMVNFNVKSGKIYHVWGPELPRGGLPEGFTPPMIVGGYALTPNIPGEFWNNWVEQNKMAEYFTPPDGAEHGFIYAYPTTASARDAAKEQTKLLTGLEPLSNDKDKDGRLTDPRLPKPLGAGMTPVAREPYPSAEGEAASINQPA
jgi:hypothetical protein